jgi:hypothetical protein
MKKIRKPYRKSNLWKRAFQNVSLEDVIKPIYRHFIEPFMENQPIHPKDMLRIWFDTDNRDVYFAIVKKTIAIPGHIRDADTNQDYIPPAEKREAKKGDQVVVRFDKLRPAFVEIEFNGLVFLMGTEHYNRIAGSIALVG